MHLQVERVYGRMPETMNTHTITIRVAHTDDVDSIAEIVCELAEKFILSSSDKAVTKAFIEANNAQQIRQNINSNYHYFVAVKAGKMVGLIGMKGYDHLYHLFVLERYQGLGLARQLWNKARSYCLDNGNPGLFTVNASTNAIPVYEALGFKRTAPTQQKNGIVYNPMRLGNRGLI